MVKWLFSKEKRSLVNKKMMTQKELDNILIDGRNEKFDDVCFYCDVFKMGKNPIKKLNEEKECCYFFYDFDLSYDESHQIYMLSISLSGENEKECISTVYSQFKVITEIDLKNVKAIDLLKNSNIREKINVYLQTLKSLINKKGPVSLEEYNGQIIKYTYNQLSELTFVMGENFHIQDMEKEPLFIKKNFISNSGLTEIQLCYGYPHQYDINADKKQSEDEQWNHTSMFIVKGYGIYDAHDTEMMAARDDIGLSLEPYFHNFYIEFKKAFNYLAH